MSRTESEVNETLDPPSSIWPSLLPPLRTPQQPCFQRVGPVPNIPTESAEPWPVALCQRRSSAGTIQDFQRNPVGAVLNVRRNPPTHVPAGALATDQVAFTCRSPLHGHKVAS